MGSESRERARPHLINVLSETYTPESMIRENMSAAKQLLREAVEQVPEDASIEDVMERLYFLAKVTHGLDAANRGDVIAHDDIEREFSTEG